MRNLLTDISHYASAIIKNECLFSGYFLNLSGYALYIIFLFRLIFVIYNRIASGFNTKMK